MYHDDTIVALSTPPGEGGIGIIRLSGIKAFDIAKKIFVLKDKKPLTNVKERYMNLGYIIDDNGKVIDEVLLVYMMAPKTYTKEDIIEIHCHGGMVPINSIIKLTISKGARLAEPGEFTKRAFLNGRIDLTQAEGIMDLICAKSEEAARISLNQMEGTLSRKINEMRERLLDLLAHIEVTVDYPEDDIEEAVIDNIKESLYSLKEESKDMLETSDHGKIIREGIKTVIVGKPNVGKSSLLNTLLQENKAIVTDIPGTTRDVIEDYVIIGGVLLHIIDTAGIRDTDDYVESIGVEKSKALIKEADLIIMLLDVSQPLTSEDEEIIRYIDDKEALLLLNKIDLPFVMDKEKLSTLLSGKKVLEVSLKDKTGIEEIKDYIYNMAYAGKITAKNGIMIANMRHKQALIKAIEFFDEAVKGIEAGFPLDMISIDIRNAWNSLGEITGETLEENLIDRIFSNFCLGK